MKTLELAQLDGNKPYVNTDDFGVKVNLLYFEKDGLALRTRYSNNKDTFFITFLLDLADSKNEEFYDYLRRRLVQGYTYFITQADNKLEYKDYNKHYDGNGNVYLELSFLGNQGKGVGNE